MFEGILKKVHPSFDKNSISFTDFAEGNDYPIGTEFLIWNYSSFPQYIFLSYWTKVEDGHKDIQWRSVICTVQRTPSIDV